MAESQAIFSARGLQAGDVVGPYLLLEKSRGTCGKTYIYSWLTRCTECGCERPILAHNLKRYVGGKCRCSPLWEMKEHGTWYGMLNRCYKPTEDAYRFYGAIGHYVCKRWRDSFENFLADMGKAPSPDHSIDRIDTLKHYTCGKCDECSEKGDPANCRWATKDVQARNMKNNLWFTHNGETKILTDWCREFNLTYRVIHRRIYDHGWSFEKAISTPIVKRQSRQG